MQPLIIAAAVPGPDASPVAPWQVMLMVLGVVMLGVILTLRTRLRVARSVTKHEDPVGAVKRVQSRAAMRGDADAMAAELYDVSARLTGQLTQQATRLEHLIALADERIEELAARSADLEPLTIGPDDESSGAPVLLHIDETLPHDRLPMNPPPAEPQGSEGNDRLATEILRLADEGRSAVEIAQELDEHTGKIELILALRRGA